MGMPSPATQAHAQLDALLGGTDYVTAEAMCIVLRALQPGAGRPVSPIIIDALAQLHDAVMSQTVVGPIA
jgi:hypothetical protein